MIFQEPMLSLSPLHTIGDQVSEALFLHHPVSNARKACAQTAEMLRLVGFPDPGARAQACIRSSCPAGCGSAR